MSACGLPSPTVLAAAAQGLAERIAQAGVDPHGILREAGLRSLDLADPIRRIGLAQYCRAFELAAHRTTRVNFGLEFGASFQPQQLGLLGYLAISAPTLGFALRKFAAYLPAHQQATHMGVRELDDGAVAVEYAILDDAVKDRQQDAELSIGMLLNLFRHCLGARWLPAAVHLMHTRPAGRTRYEDLLGVRPLFEQTSNRIVFRRADLECPMPRQDERLLRLLEAELKKQMPSGRAAVDVVARARHEIVLAMDSTDLDLTTISQRCGLQPWTLKRRLKEQGTTFQELVATTRHELAIARLARGTPITEVALMLGFSEVSAFSRAFRQWTGQSPRRFLSAQRRN